MVTGSYWLINSVLLAHLPNIFSGGDQLAWRYTLISGVLPALPLIFIRPFLPESPVWREKRAAGTLRRPSVLELFRPTYLRTSLVSAALFACGFGAAFGAIQLTPQMVPGLFPDLGRGLASNRAVYEAAKEPDKLAALKRKMDDADKKASESSSDTGAKKAAEIARKQYDAAVAASQDQTKLGALREKVEEDARQMEEHIAGIQTTQEIGGLAGRFALAFLATLVIGGRLLGRRVLLWLFQVPGLLLIPLVYLFPAAGKLPDHNVEMLMVGMFIAGFFTVAQFSFWGNYLPRVYPTYLRGTGESFAANVGGRMVGTAFNPLTVSLAPLMASAVPGLTRFSSVAYAAAAVALLVYGVGALLTFFLPEPNPHGEE